MFASNRLPSITKGAGALILPCLLLTSSHVAILAAQSQSQTASGDEAATLSGVVVNANTNQPLGRSLVQVGGHSVLTGPDGKFEFTDRTGASSSLRVTKPGFYDGNAASTITRPIAFTSTAKSIEVRLYPEAILTGTTTDQEGDPLGQIPVLALRREHDESGEHWTISGQTTSNADGQFRLSVAGGDYVVQTQYLPESPGHRKAILPMMLPAAETSGRPGNASSTMHLASGTEQHLDLKPPVRSSFPVHIRVDAGDGNPPQLEAHLANGLSFSLSVQGSEVPGVVTASIPSGTYTVSATTNNQAQVSYAETRVTITDHEVFGVELHRVRALPLTVELALDPATTSDNQQVTAQQLGLYFYRTDAGITYNNQNVYLAQHGNGSDSAILPPGRYRLRAQSFGQWFVESANVGGSDLLSQDLDVDAGGSETPLRLVISNKTASIKSTVKLAGEATACWVYLIAAFPSATPVLASLSGPDGSFTRSSLPAGNYRAIAFETRQDIDFNEPAALAEFGAKVKTVTVGVGETAVVELDAVTDSELKR